MKKKNDEFLKAIKKKKTSKKPQPKIEREKEPVIFFTSCKSCEDFWDL